jgi:hypothetical protein
LRVRSHDICDVSVRRQVCPTPPKPSLRTSRFCVYVLCLRLRLCVRVCVRACMCVPLCARACMHARVYTYAYKHSHLRTLTRTCIHPHTLRTSNAHAPSCLVFHTQHMTALDQHRAIEEHQRHTSMLRPQVLSLC